MYAEELASMTPCEYCKGNRGINRRLLQCCKFIISNITILKYTIIQATFKSLHLQSTKEFTHKPCRIVFVFYEFSINIDKYLHYNGYEFIVCESIFQPVTNKNHKRKAFPTLVLFPMKISIMVNEIP